jgi:hypothetical protein
MVSKIDLVSGWMVMPAELAERDSVIRFEVVSLY